MFKIRSTYDEWAPEYDEYPDGRQWPGRYLTHAGAWVAIRDYLGSQQWQLKPSRARPSELGMAPFGHEEPTAFFGQTKFQNDAETIHIVEE